MKVKIKDLQPNPFKQYINKGVLSKNRLDVMKESISHGTLPENFRARENNGIIEITSGHHRHGALTKFKGGDYEVDVTIVDFTDEQMLIDMVRENLTQRGNDYKDIADSCMLAKVWLESGSNKKLLLKTLSKRGRLGEGRPKSPASAAQIAKFLSKKGKSITQPTVSKYIRIEEQGIDELKEKTAKSKQGHTEEGKIGVELSAKIASFPKDEQKGLLKIVRETKFNRDEIGKLLTEYKNAPDDIKKLVREGEVRITHIEDAIIFREMKDVAEKNPRFVFIPNFAGRLRDFDDDMVKLEIQVSAFGAVFRSDRFKEKYSTLKPNQKKTLNALILNIHERIKNCYDDVEFFASKLSDKDLLEE